MDAAASADPCGCVLYPVVVGSACVSAGDDLAYNDLCCTLDGNWHFISELY